LLHLSTDSAASRDVDRSSSTPETGSRSARIRIPRGTSKRRPRETLTCPWAQRVRENDVLTPEPTARLRGTLEWAPPDFRPVRSIRTSVSSDDVNSECDDLRRKRRHIHPRNTTRDRRHGRHRACTLTRAGSRRGTGFDPKEPPAARGHRNLIAARLSWPPSHPEPCRREDPKSLSEWYLDSRGFQTSFWPRRTHVDHGRKTTVSIVTGARNQQNGTPRILGATPPLPGAVGLQPRRHRGPGTAENPLGGLFHRGRSQSAREVPQHPHVGRVGRAARLTAGTSPALDPQPAVTPRGRGPASGLSASDSEAEPDAGTERPMAVARPRG